MPSIHKHLSNVSAYAEAIYSLSQGPCTIRELVDESGMAHNTARKFIFSLRRRSMVHIAAWEKDTTGRFTVAAYGWGEGKDVKRPPSKTMEERKAKYLEKIRDISLRTGVPLRRVRLRKPKDHNGKNTRQ
jgi:hypothetical protein